MQALLHFGKSGLKLIRGETWASLLVKKKQQTMQGKDVCPLTFKGAYHSANWVISENIKALFL